MTGMSDKRRRWLGAIFLLAALIMLVAGETVLEGRLGTIGFILFWMACFAFTCLALLIAFIDAAIVRRRARQEHRQFLEHTLREIAREKEDKSRRQPGA